MDGYPLATVHPLRDDDAHENKPVGVGSRPPPPASATTFDCNRDATPSVFALRTFDIEHGPRRTTDRTPPPSGTPHTAQSDLPTFHALLAGALDTRAFRRHADSDVHRLGLHVTKARVRQHSGLHFLRNRQITPAAGHWARMKGSD